MPEEEEDRKRTERWLHWIDRAKVDEIEKRCGLSAEAAKRAKDLVEHATHESVLDFVDALIALVREEYIRENITVLRVPEKRIPRQ